MQGRRERGAGEEGMHTSTTCMYFRTVFGFSIGAGQILILYFG